MYHKSCRTSWNIFSVMAHLAALPLLEWVAGEAALPLFTAAAAGTLAGGIKRTVREGVFGRKSLMKRNIITPSPYNRSPKRQKTMGYSPKRLFSGRSARRSQYNNQLGRRPGSYKVRRHTVTAQVTNVPDKTVNSFRLIYVGHDTDETKINKRRANIANVKGVKLNCWFQMPEEANQEFASVAYPIQVRWAVINPKDNNGGGTISTNEFFIAANPEDTLTRDFPASGDSFQFMNRKINREQYGVLKEGHFVLRPDPGNAATVTPSAPNTGNKRMAASTQKNIKCYVPVKRQMQWADTATTKPTHPEQNLYFVWWYCKLGDMVSGNRFSAANPAVLNNHEMTTFFTNAKLYS
mgnify:CR=1 FL=1